MIRITLFPKIGNLEGRLTAEVFRICEGLPARKRWDAGKLVFENVAANVRYLQQQLPTAQWDDRTSTLSLLDQLAESSGQVQMLKSTPIEAVEIKDYPFKTQPFDHQKAGFAMSRGKRAFAYLMDMGTGKTKLAIDVAADLFLAGRINRVVIVAPNGVHTQWLNEQLPAHLPDRVYGVSWMGTWKEEPPAKWVVPLHWYAINYEAISSANGAAAWLKSAATKQTLIILDESHRIKTPGAAITKKLYRLAHLFGYRRILTGTPVARGLEDMFAQFRFIDPSILGHTTFSSFKGAYCVMGGHEGQEIVSYRNVEHFQSLIAGHSFRVRKDDVLDLPPKVYVRRPVPLSAEQRRHYDRLKSELMTQLSDGSLVEVPHVIQRILRLQQVVCGHLPREDGTLEELDCPRLKVADEVITEAAGPVVVWARFRNDIDRLMSRHKARAVRYDGSLSAGEKERAKDAFMKGDADLFIANQAAGGTGLNLAGRANTVLYYSNSFSSLDRWQSEDRTHRIGTKGSVTYVDLVARGTTDTAILANLRRKREVSDMTLNEIRDLLMVEDDV